MELTGDLCEVNNRRIGISLRMNSKRRVDGREWSEHKKQTNAIHFECKRRNVAQVLNYFKHTYPSKLAAVQAGKTPV